ncbi:MAG: hypothetical protein JWO30_311 [Fibrobacteres bacterium]|nr:hypothetical protein [Fibrobacterota bacterium]
MEAALKGKKGILFFKVNIWSDAQGHFTLWNGEKCSDNAYFREAVKVSLWKVVKPVAAAETLRVATSDDSVRVVDKSGVGELS